MRLRAKCINNIFEDTLTVGKYYEVHSTTVHDNGDVDFICKNDRGELEPFIKELFEEPERYWQTFKSPLNGAFLCQLFQPKPPKQASTIRFKPKQNLY